MLNEDMSTTKTFPDWVEDIELPGASDYLNDYDGEGA